MLFFLGENPSKDLRSFRQLSRAPNRMHLRRSFAHADGRIRGPERRRWKSKLPRRHLAIMEREESVKDRRCFLAVAAGNMTLSAAQI